MYWLPENQLFYTQLNIKLFKNIRLHCEAGSKDSLGRVSLQLIDKEAVNSVLNLVSVSFWYIM